MKSFASMLFLLAAGACTASAADRPNILWLFAEDTSPWMGCYGHEVNRGHTPNIDGMADRGVRFSRAFVPAPVCSPCRSAMMGGMNQIRFNAHEHRSSRGPAKIQLPEDMKLLPELVKESGYFTFNLGKDDYNFVWDQPATFSLQKKSREGIPWETLKDNQPFFGQIQTAGGKNRTNNFPADRKASPDEVTVPPDYPQNQIYREVVAQHCDAIRQDDDFIGTVLNGLKESGLHDNTIVVYFSDHGANNLVRHKQMPTEGGLHVPFIITGPDPYVPAPSVRDDLVNLLDLSATTLVWAGVKIPDWYEGQYLFDGQLVPREFVASGKDRLDHTIDRVRSIRTDRFRYTRNYKTDRIFLQPQYRDRQPYTKNLHELYASGKLSDKLTEIYFAERPGEELYDVKKDPSQLHNLIDDPKYADEVVRHRKLLDSWLAKGDDGEGEESMEELAYQAQDHKWGKAVNPEYEVVREDSDGDGLSDAWERNNGRDPDDGRLLYTFDCGGWQTEGWESSDLGLGNIAGRLGFLDFTLPKQSGTITRKNLKLDPAKNAGDVQIKLRVSEPTRLTMTGMNGSGEFAIGSTQVKKGDGFRTVTLNAPDIDSDIQQLNLRFESAAGTVIEIDSILCPGSE